MSNQTFFHTVEELIKHQSDKKQDSIVDKNMVAEEGKCNAESTHQNMEIEN